MQGYQAGQSLAGIGSGSTVANNTVTQATEMSALSTLLTTNRERLRSLLSLVEERLDGFAPQPSQLGAKASEAPPEPFPGTLSHLRCMIETTGQDLSRLDAICTRLRELL